MCASAVSGALCIHSCRHKLEVGGVICTLQMRKVSSRTGCHSQLVSDLGFIVPFDSATWFSRLLGVFCSSIQILGLFVSLKNAIGILIRIVDL